MYELKKKRKNKWIIKKEAHDCLLFFIRLLLCVVFHHFSSSSSETLIQLVCTFVGHLLEQVSLFIEIPIFLSLTHTLHLTKMTFHKNFGFVLIHKHLDCVRIFELMRVHIEVANAFYRLTGSGSNAVSSTNHASCSDVQT